MSGSLACMGTADSPDKLTFSYVDWESIGPENTGDGKMIFFSPQEKEIAWVMSNQ